MSGKAFLCEGMYQEEAIRALRVNWNWPGEEVQMEDLGSDWEEENVCKNNEKWERKMYCLRGQRTPKVDWAREEEIEAEE